MSRTLTRLILSSAVISLSVVGLSIALVPTDSALAQPKTTSFTNPLKGGPDTIEAALTKVIQFMLGLVGLLAIGAIIYGGIRIITGLGNENAVSQGKKIITWAVGGLIVIGLAYAIITIIATALGVKTK